MITSHVNGLGFPSFSSIAKTALNPIAATKASVKATTAVAKPVARTTVAVAKTTGKVVYQAHAIPTKYLGVKPTEWLASKATAPIKNRIRTLVNRRAAKIAMDRRHVPTPTPAEVAEARKWVKHKLTYDGPAGTPTPHGKILAQFAGADAYEMGGMLGSYYDGQLGVAPAVVAAAVPVLLALANAMVAKYAKSGEAPANPQADAQANASDPITPGTYDLQPMQNAVAEQSASMAMDAGGDPVAAAAEGDPSASGSELPGGIKRNHLIIGGAVLGGILLIAMLKK